MIRGKVTTGVLPPAQVTVKWVDIDVDGKRLAKVQLLDAPMGRPVKRDEWVFVEWNSGRPFARLVNP